MEFFGSISSDIQRVSELRGNSRKLAGCSWNGATTFLQNFPEFLSANLPFTPAQNNRCNPSAHLVYCSHSLSAFGNQVSDRSRKILLYFCNWWHKVISERTKKFCKRKNRPSMEEECFMSFMAFY